MNVVLGFLVVIGVVCGRQNVLCPPDVLLPAVAVRHDRLEPGPIGGANFDLDPLAHGSSLTRGFASKESLVRLGPLGGARLAARPSDLEPASPVHRAFLQVGLHVLA